MTFSQQLNNKLGKTSEHSERNEDMKREWDDEGNGNEIGNVARNFISHSGTKKINLNYSMGECICGFQFRNFVRDLKEKSNTESSIYLVMPVACNCTYIYKWL